MHDWPIRVMAGVVTHASTPFIGDLQAAARARRFVREVLTGWGHDSADAEQMVSELVNNALEHTRSGQHGGIVSVSVAVDATLVRVEVVDDGTDGSLNGDAPFPAVRNHAALAECGRGLRIVDGYSDGWGARRHHAGGLLVWFEINLPPRGV